MSVDTNFNFGGSKLTVPFTKVDFVGSKVRASRTSSLWPDEGFPVRRGKQPSNPFSRVLAYDQTLIYPLASVNAFGYGGSNAHAIIEQPTVSARSNHTSSYMADGDEEIEDEGTAERLHTLVLSANDATSLKAGVQALCNHLINPRVQVNIPDLAYTLSERRTGLWHRAFVTTNTSEVEVNDFVTGKKSSQPPKIGFIFTGQGAQ